jgi:L-ascorbate metabolism protein UlaG (beta-lactamase superfamily)
VVSEVKVTWLGHATVVLDVAGRRLVTDPLLCRHNGVLRRRGPAPAVRAWAGADAVLLSHLHHDHAELRSLRRLPGVPVLTGPSNAHWLRAKGLHGVGLDAGLDAAWYDVDEDVRVRLVDAEHRTRRMPHRPNGTYGHLVQTPRATIWFAGDTGLFPDMAVLPELAGSTSIDLALVPIGGWGPRLPEGHLGPDEAATACAMARVRCVVPVHWGTLHFPAMHRVGGWMDHPAPAFEEAVRRTSPDCRVLTLAPGTSVTVPERPGPA